MFDLKKLGLVLGLVLLLTLSTWSVGEEVFSLQLVLNLLNPAQGRDNGVALPLVALHLGLVFVFLKAISTGMSDFFSLENYILTKKGKGFFVKSCMAYVTKNTLKLWCVLVLANVIISCKDLPGGLKTLLVVWISALVSLLIWVVLWLLLMLLSASSKGAMACVMGLIAMGIFTSQTFPGGLFALCPDRLFESPGLMIAGKIALAAVAAAAVSLVLRKYESIGGGK